MVHNPTEYSSKAPTLPIKGRGAKTAQPTTNHKIWKLQEGIGRWTENKLNYREEGKRDSGLDALLEEDAAEDGGLGDGVLRCLLLARVHLESVDAMEEGIEAGVEPVDGDRDEGPEDFVGNPYSASHCDWIRSWYGHHLPQLIRSKGYNGCDGREEDRSFVCLRRRRKWN